MGIGLTVDLTDAVQATAGVGLFIPDRGPAFGMASLKVRALDRGRFHLAAFAGSFGWFGEHHSAVFAGVGSVAGLCLDEACGSVLSGTVLAGAAFRDPDEGVSDRDYGLVVTPSVVIAVATPPRPPAPVPPGPSPTAPDALLPARGGPAAAPRVACDWANYWTE